MKYYEENFQAFVDRSLPIDMSDAYEPFLKLLPAEANILEIGSGAGRDLKYFSSLGHDILGLEPSPKLAEHARAHSGCEVLDQAVSELDRENEFDGIWAVASLLHLPFSELPDAFERLAKALKAGGVLYASFKWGDFEGLRDSRHFTDMTEERAQEVLAQVPELEVIEIHKGASYVPHKKEPWLEIRARKTP